MPPLTAEAQQAIEVNIKKKMDSCNCTVCGNKTWIYPEALYELKEFFGLPMNMAGSIIPVVIVTCQICGNMLLFNAIHTGALQAKAQV
jgi:ribosomal protein S27E